MKIEGGQYLFLDAAGYFLNVFKLRKCLDYNLPTSLMVRGFVNDSDVLGKNIRLGECQENNLAAGEILQRVEHTMEENNMIRAKICIPFGKNGGPENIRVYRRFRITN